MIKKFELIPKNGRKSFGGKAVVLEEFDDKQKFIQATLVSYNIKVCKVDTNGEITLTGLYSSTTLNHIKSFLTTYEYILDNEKYQELIKSGYAKKNLTRLLEEK